MTGEAGSPTGLSAAARWTGAAASGGVSSRVAPGVASGMVPQVGSEETLYAYVAAMDPGAGWAGCTDTASEADMAMTYGVELDQRASKTGVVVTAKQHGR